LSCHEAEGLVARTNPKQRDKKFTGFLLKENQSVREMRAHPDKGGKRNG